MSKTILCLTDGLSLGGAERQLIGLAYFLKCRGYKVELCSYLKRDFYNELIASYGINAVCLNVEGGKISKFSALRKHIKKGKYDCLIAYKDGATFTACFLRLLGMRFKLIVSDRNTNLIINRRDKLKFFLFKFADYIVPNSHSQESFIVSNFSNLKTKVVTITNFTDTSYFSPSSFPKTEREKVRMMVAARISKQKNILKFLESVRKLKDNNLPISVTWFGNVSHGEEEYEKECRLLIKELELEDVFKFKPATKNILEEYQNYDVFCLPSLYEGYPNAVCEAMSCGMPVLCSRVCDNALIVEEGLNGYLFNPEDVDNMYNVISSFIKLPYIDKLMMGKKSRELALNKFSQDVFVEKYIKLIEG